MPADNSGIRFLGYEVLKFQFERGAFSEKRGWSFYPEVRCSSPGAMMRGEVVLSASAFFDKDEERSFHVQVLLRGLFQGEDVTPEEFRQYCLVKGSAHLIPVLRTLVNDFLERVGSPQDATL